MGTLAGRIRVGPSGWSYDDWEGIVYPKPRPAGFHPLRYLSGFFDAVEVNSSFYRIPSAAMTGRWPALVPEGFRFAVKLWQGFTHARGSFPGDREVGAFSEALEPLRGSGRLGPLLIQFPWSFRATAGSRDWLLRLRDAFASFVRIVEVRHRSWATEAGLAFLRSVGGYCNVDQPQLRDCIGPTAHAFGPVGYVRLHGRNAANWFARGKPAFERYNYLYSEAELRDWLDRIRSLAEASEEVYVFANNHYQGQGPANALELMSMLAGNQIPMPAPLVRAYGRLADRALPPAQGDLFGAFE